MTSFNNINIAILGPVSAGKSTFMNALFVKQFSDMKIKRTTMTPQVYCETDNLDLSLEDINKIKSKNKEINDILIKKSENGEVITYEEISNTIEYQVPKVFDLHNLKKNVYLHVYDIPGLNDARTQELYLQYLDKHFHEWDIILMVVDINSAMNTEGEVRILNNIVEYSKRNLDKYGIQNKLFILANKVDDLEHCKEWGLRIADEEYTEMYDQIKKQVKDVIEKVYPKLDYYVMPLSSEDAFIYRMYAVNPNVELDIKHINKFGHNEFGKSKWNRFTMNEKHNKMKQIMSGMNIKDRLQLTGFNYFKDKFQKVLSNDNQYRFLINHIMFKCNELIEAYKVKNELVYYDYFLDVYNKIMELNGIYNMTSGLERFYKYLDQFIELYKIPHLIISLDALVNTQEEHIENLEWAQLHCKKWSSKFGKSYTKLSDIGKEITNALNKYYSKNIEEQQKPMETLLSRFVKLFHNGYKITRYLIKKIFTHNDILDKQPEEIISIINNLMNKSLITEEQRLEMLSTLLGKIYNSINKDFGDIKYMNNGNDGNVKLKHYIYFADIFWTKQIVKIVNSNVGNSDVYKFSMMMKCICNKHLTFDNLDNVIYDLSEMFDIKHTNSLESYFIKLI